MGTSVKPQKVFNFNLKKQSINSLRHGSLVLAGVIITVILNVVLAFHLSAAYYGNYTLIIRNASFIALILTFGFDVSANRYLSNYIVARRYHLAKGFLVIALFILAITCFVYLLGLIGFSFIAESLKSHGWIHVKSLVSVRWLWLAILMAFLQLGMVFLRSVNRADEGFFWGTVAQYALLLIAVYFGLKEHLSPSASFYRVLDLTAISYGIAVLMMVWETYRFLVRRIKTESRIKWRTKKWVRVSMVMMGYSVVSLMVPAVILNIVEWMPSIPGYQVGVFALGVTVSSCFGLIPSFTVKGSVMAWMKPLFKTNQHNKLAKLIVYSNWASIIFNVISFIILAIFGHLFIHHLPKAYAHLYPIVLVLMSSYVFDPSLTATRSALMMMGKQNQVLFARVTTIILLILFCTLGAYYKGILGTAIGLVATQLLIAFLDMYFLHRLGYQSLWVKG
jgi:O-antigen/teichoic acid export membrane protein